MRAYLWMSCQNNVPPAADQRQVLTAIEQTTYGCCTVHSDCEINQFCSLKCWTGWCGAAKRGPKCRGQQFCQPCAKCKLPFHSVTRTCGVCNIAGTPSALVFICRLAFVDMTVSKAKVTLIW